MLDEELEIEQKWNNSSLKWYQNKGYIFTHQGDLFKVKIKDLSPSSRIKVFPVCDYCGKEYETSYSTYISGHKAINKDCCCNCTGKKISEVSLKKRAHKYLTAAKERCDQLGYVLLTSEAEYTDVKMYIKIDIGDNNIQEVILDNFIRGHDCFINSYNNRQYNRLSINFINSRIEEQGNIWLNPQDYTSSIKTILKIKCKCGNEFQTNFVNYLRHDVNRCPQCSQSESKGEVYIKNILIKNNINYIPQHKFDDCRDKRVLPFDFYLPNYNACIEFDGQYHYKIIYDEETLLLTQKHDNIKNTYCKINNIPLLRIPYYEADNAEEKIINFINSISYIKDIV